jgi:hypothetical protein
MSAEKMFEVQAVLTVRPIESRMMKNEAVAGVIMRRLQAWLDAQRPEIEGMVLHQFDDLQILVSMRERRE